MAGLAGEMHAHQVRERLCLHFLHDPGSMDFNGSLTDAEFVGDDLVRLAGDDKIENLVFAIRKLADTITNFGFFAGK